MKITEIFYSIQGEGFLAGRPSVFIRLAGCPLRCRWCDTKYAWDTAAADELTIVDIIDSIKDYNSNFAVVTGGEPMINPDLPLLLKELKARGKHITVETAGIAFWPNLVCDLMSISPKLNNSLPREPHLAAIHKNVSLDTAVLSYLIDYYPYQLKFIVASKADLRQIQRVIKDIGNIDPENVMLMPQAATRKQLLARSKMVAELCKSTGFSFSPRLQIMLWDNKRGT
jgi:7-carboxy-7-deazaguanine synthase